MCKIGKDFKKMVGERQIFMYNEIYPSKSWSMFSCDIFIEVLLFNNTLIQNLFLNVSSISCKNKIPFIHE